MIKSNFKKVVFASGCFWGTQYYLGKAKGVVKTTVGYSGGIVDSPTYQQVSTGQTGHVESVEVEYNLEKTSYEDLTKLFFETHDPTQKDGQGPDIGSQYQSVIFYGNDDEKKIAEKLIGKLSKKGMDIATELKPLEVFWPAEEYHQDYYEKNGGTPYCHIYRKLF